MNLFSGIFQEFFFHSSCSSHFQNTSWWLLLKISCLSLDRLFYCIAYCSTVFPKKVFKQAIMMWTEIPFRQSAGCSSPLALFLKYLFAMLINLLIVKLQLSQLLLTLFRMGFKRGPNSFSPVTSTNIEINLQHFLIFSFNPFATLV